jgi:hypothetical protein
MLIWQPCQIPVLGRSHSNSIQFFTIYVPSQQLQVQLQTQRSVDTSNYIMDKHNIKSKSNYTQAFEEKHINTEKVNKQTKLKRGNKNMITKNYITQNIRIMNKYY